MGDEGDRLEKAGLLYRKRCTKDRRSTYAVLTEARLEMQQKMWVVYSDGIAEDFGCQLDNGELKVIQPINR
ncbi:MAG: hypothetical protein HC936_04145 [Leptolyngbyaceae cyanobacterium SU_3_3]|nr:hypothetical protein [Leptolyngbyaceae cyanobacterium SU_3_3]